MARTKKKKGTKVRRGSYAYGELEWTTITLGRRTPVKVDVEDVKRISEHSWRVTKGTQGRARVVTSIRTRNGARSVTLGRFLMKPARGMQVYPRRFNDGLDYRKANLIVCTLQERQQLLPKNRKGTSSSYRGVSYLRKEAKWRAGIQVRGRAINLGDFSTEEQAAQAYNAAARKYFGPNAYQNPVGRKQRTRRED